MMGLQRCKDPIWGLRNRRLLITLQEKESLKLPNTGFRPNRRTVLGVPIIKSKLSAALVAVQGCGCAFLLLLGSPGGAAADNITYFVNDPLNIDVGYGTGAVTGSITTDGTIGTLTAANIVSWDMTAQFGTNSHEFVNGLSGLVFSNPSGLSATANQLLFNFTPSNNFAISEGKGTGFLIDWASGCNSGCAVY
jgi:hypothetical protein